MQYLNEYIFQFENVINTDWSSRTKQIHACWKISKETLLTIVTGCFFLTKKHLFL